MELYIAITFAAIMFIPGPASNTTALVAALLGAPVLLAMRMRGTAPSRRTLSIAAACLPLLLLMLAGTLRSADRMVSLAGAALQHTGAATWVAAMLTFCAAMMLARRGDLRRVVRAMALGGGLLAAAALFERFGMPVVQRDYAVSVGGVLAGAQELGQVLALCIGASAAWALTEKSGGLSRRIAVGLTLVMAWACIEADARAAILGILIAAVFVVIVARTARLQQVSPLAVASSLIVLVLIACVGGVVVLGAAPGDQARAWDGITSYRSAIWSTGLAKAATAPLLGLGPEQFSTWVEWSVADPKTLESGLTYSAHNVLLDVVLATGILGALALLVMCWAALWALLESVRAARFAHGALAVMGALFAWAVTLLLGWLDPLSALVSAVLAGTLIAAAPREYADGVGRAAGGTRHLRWVPAGIAVAVLFAASPGIAHAYRWNALSARSAGLEEMLAEVRRAGDPLAASSVAPAIASVAVSDPRFRPKALSDLATLEGLLADNAHWSVECAYAGFQLETARSRSAGNDDWTAAEWYLERGRQAEGGISGFWDTAGAVRAAQFEHRDKEISYRQAALRYDLPPRVRTALQATARDSQ